MINRLTALPTRRPALASLSKLLRVLRGALVVGSALFAAGTAIAQEPGVAVQQLAIGRSQRNHGKTVRLPPVDDMSPVLQPTVSPAIAWQETAVAPVIDNAVVPAQWTSGRTLAWDVGQFEVTPYGAFWADMIYATSRTFPGANTQWVLSRQEGGEETFTIDVRRTRLGIDVTGPDLPLFGGAASSGQAEIDFRSDFVTENRAGVLLRQAYWQVRNDQFRLLVGQTWDVISPLNPGRLDYSSGLVGGNIGFRRAQFRGERFFAFSETALLTVQGSLNQGIVTDFRSEAGVRAESTGWPVIDGRVAATFGPRGVGCRPVSLGVSGHIGETGFDFLTAGPPPLTLPPQGDARFRTWSFNFDFHAPISDRLGVQGEFFTGSNLSPFFGGIGQGVCPCLRRPIRATGGWLDIWYEWSPTWRSYVGFGIDDPNNADSLFGRTYNQYIYANLIYGSNARLTTGVEVTAWKTLYQETRAGLVPADQLMPSAPGEALTIDWMVKYQF